MTSSSVPDGECTGYSFVYVNSPIDPPPTTIAKLLPHLYTGKVRVATQHGPLIWLKVVIGTYMVLDDNTTCAVFGFELYDAKDFQDPFITINDIAVKFMPDLMLPPFRTYAFIIGHMASGTLPRDLRNDVVKNHCTIVPKRHQESLANELKMAVAPPTALASRISCKCGVPFTACGPLHIDDDGTLTILAVHLGLSPLC